MSLSEKIEHVYLTFSEYPDMNGFCTYCYDQQEIEYYRTTSLRQIEMDKGRKLLWETGDHWESAAAIKHYLPRILEILYPPYLVEQLYPNHLLETLQYHNFSAWPEHEKTAVLSLLAEAKVFFKDYGTDDWSDWDKGILRLVNPSRNLTNL